MAKLNLGRKTPFYPNFGSGVICLAGTKNENGVCVRKSTTSKPAYVPTTMGSSKSAKTNLKLATSPAKKKLVLGGMRF